MAREFILQDNESDEEEERKQQISRLNRQSGNSTIVPTHNASFGSSDVSKSANFPTQSSQSSNVTQKRTTIAKMPLEGIAEDERELLDDSVAIKSGELQDASSNFLKVEEKKSDLAVDPLSINRSTESD